MHKARDFINNQWQSSAIDYPGSRPVLFHTNNNQPWAYNKTIDQQNVIPALPIALMDRNNKMISQFTLTPDNTTYDTPNGLPYEIARYRGQNCDNPYKYPCIENEYDNMVWQQPSTIVSADGSTFNNAFKQKSPSIYGTNIVPTQKGKRVELDYKNEFGRTFTNPTCSDTNINNTTREVLNSSKLSRAPLIELENCENSNQEIIRNPTDNVESIIIEHRDDKHFLNTPDVVKQEYVYDIGKHPIKQKKSRYSNIVNDFNNNLPIYMQNIDKTALLTNANRFKEHPELIQDINPVDAYTNKLLNNKGNPFLTKDTLDENTRPMFSAQNKLNRNITDDASNNKNFAKYKENSHFTDGVNEPQRGFKQKEKSAIVENFQPKTTSVNEKTKLMKEAFKEGKYNMHIDNLIEPFAAPRNSNSAGATMDQNLKSIYMNNNNYESEMLKNSMDTTPFIYNLSYIEDNDGTKSKQTTDELNEFALPEFEQTIVTESEYIPNDPAAFRQFSDREFKTAYGVNRVGNKIKVSTNNNKREGFQNATPTSTATETYIVSLKARALAICQYLQEHKDFQHWAENWKHMRQNIDKSGWVFQVLDKSDADVAYVENKGELIRFRIRDDQRWVPLNVYTYVLCHEMAHLANWNEWGHGPNFQNLMHLIEVAAYGCGFMHPSGYPAIGEYKSNGTTILSKDSIKHELVEGVKLIIAYNNGNPKFYNDMIIYINSL